jgi:hypothetical protein
VLPERVDQFFEETKDHRETAKETDERPVPAILQSPA